MLFKILFKRKVSREEDDFLRKLGRLILYKQCNETIGLGEKMWAALRARTGPVDNTEEACPEVYAAWTGLLDTFPKLKYPRTFFLGSEAMDAWRVYMNTPKTGRKRRK